MPGVTAQATYFFVTKDNEGWTENLFINGTDINDCSSLAFQYIALRLAASPNNVDIEFAKVSDTAIKGDSLIAQPSLGTATYPYQGTYAESPSGAFLEANTALLFMLTAGPTKRNRIFLRGLSLDVVTGREFLNPSAFTTAMTAIGTFWTTTCNVRTKDKPATHPPTYTYAPVTTWSFVKVTARKPGRPFGAPRGRKFAHRHALLLAAPSSTTSELATPQKPGSPPVRRR